MKTPSSLEELQVNLTKELYRTFKFFNKTFAKDQLPEPVIMVQANQEAYGWFRQNSWTAADGTAILEITITAQCLNAGVDEIMNTMLHQMGHMQNFIKGIADCDDKQFHNENFKNIVPQFGLQAVKVKRRGYAQTVHTEKSRAAIAKLKPKTDLYTLYYNAFNAIKQEKEKKDKPTKLAPVIISTEIKELIKNESESLNVTQKELTEKAVLFYLHMLKNSPDVIPAEFKLVEIEK